VDVTKVLIVDDQRIFRVMLREILSTVPEFELLGEAANGLEAIDMAKVLRPEVVLMDIELDSDMNGIQAGHAIKALRPATGIVLFSNHKVTDYIVNGSGWSYLLKNNVGDLDILIRAINGAAWGMVAIDPELTKAMKPRPTTPLLRLSPEPAKILELMTQGYGNSAIAKGLLINERAVEEWQDVIFHDLGIEHEEGIDPRLKAVSAYLSQTKKDLSDEFEVNVSLIPKRIIPLSEITNEHIKVLEMVAKDYSDLAIAEALLIDEIKVRVYLDVTYHQMGIGSNSKICSRVAVAQAYSRQVESYR